MECNNSSFTISLSPNATYHAVDLVIHRQFKGQYAENLVKWALIETQADNTVDKDGKGKVSVRKEYQIWMRREEMEACCPHLLSLETVKAAPGSSGMQEKVEGGRLGQKMDTGVEGMPDGEEPLLEMAEDIKNLIFRARRLRNRAGPSMNPAVGKMLANTINILSAYAKVGALANTFRENGALDLLLTLLSSLYPDVRQSAGDMLRSLATFDLSSRAYVLLKLAKIDDRDPVHKSTTVQSRQMLLDLFSETASSSESEVLLKGITLPQIPGRFIFSLLKKYLRVTSVKQDDTTSSPLTKMGSTIFQSQEPSEFENFYASDQLVSELFAIFGWFEGSLAKEVQKGVLRAMRGVSIFAGTVPSEQKPTKEIKNPYKTRDEFISDRDYGHYIKATLKPGMKVRARISYESVSQGDYGVYRQTNDGTPPAQFSWDGLGDTYWVFWHQVEILPSPDDEDQEEKDESAIAASLSQPSASRQPYVMRSLPLPGGWGHTGQHKSDKQVEQPFWWEVLCVIKSQAEEQTDAVIEILNDKQLKRFEDLINYSPSYSQVAKVVEHLESVHPYLSHEPLTIKEKSHFRDVYTDKTEKIPPAKEDVTLEDDLNGHFKRDPPYPDPYDREEPLRIQFPFDLDDDPPFGLLHPFPNLARRHRDMPGSLMHLRLLEHSQDGSLLKLTSAKELFEMVLEKMPSSCRLAHQGLRIMKCGCELIRRDSDRQECCVSGLFSFILRLMQIEKTSFTLQCIGIECFFHLVGGFGIDSSLIHLDQSEKKPELVSSATKNVIVTMLCSLASVPEGGGLKALVDGIKCVAECFHTRLPGTQKRSAVTSVRGGLIILTLLLKDKDVVAKLSEWGVPDLLQAVSTEMPEFSGKKDLLVHIGHCIPDFVLETVLGSADVTPEYVSTMNREIISVVKALRKLDDIALKNPLSRIVALINKDILSRDKFVEVSPLFVSLFLRHHGVFYLCQALEMNRSSQFTDQAIMILGSLIKFNEETAADVVLQGGLRAIVNIMCNNSVNRECQKSCLQMIRTLSKDPDHLVVMAAENIITPLKNAKEKFQGDSEICDQASELADLCETEETSRAALHQKILRIIFSGVLQMFLGAIEEARRGGQLICLPKFSPFIKYLSAGSGGAVSALQEQWWEAIEVSSNPQSKDNLLDGRKTTFWESSGRSGTHWIRLHMKQGLVIKKMYLEVSSDATFMPQRVTVHGGSTVDNAQEISTVYIPSTFNGSYEIVSNASKFYAVIVIRIKRCQMGGVDCRIRGIKCQATTTSLWPLFGDIFSARSKLFYRIQLQTWLKNSNLGPLEIFDKLSAVILYEQVFGDNFLHTVQARQCIGQACRSALITPLIEKLTLRSSGAPDLGQSIHDYIGQMQPPLISQWRALAACVSGVGGSSQDIGAGGRTLDMDVLSQDSLEPLDFDKAQKRLVKMSQIRRLCRLLVDCDDNITTKNSIENDDKQDGSKFKGVGSKDDRQAEPTLSPGSGTMALARCWRDIVESEVTVVLKKFDLDSPYSVASEILSIYDRLKQAMFELFGGHSQFALAMKEGFSKSFQSLDEVTGVRFCELLCLCIDSLMDSAGKDTSKLQNLGEHQREALLFHFAEPLQFLHNLDLAHIFEHYYRRHLSSRLLRGRSISLLLERRLAQTFAHCFPHKFPLQMLQDLDESQGLMDRFCDSELLESLDQLMVQASGQSSLPPEIVKLAQKCSLYRQRVFQVYSLNPCFWPVRQSPLPVSHLPPQLAQFCEDYTKFFTSMHECGLQQHERPRRLHFTLHGWAVLVFSGVRLIVSTVQMCILLQFRTVQSHGVRSLQEATQIPYQDLCDALLSLTADRQCILTMTQPDNHATPTPQDDDLISSLQSTPFKVNTLFKVNDGFTKDATAKLKTNKVRFHDVRLAARGHASHPSRADRTIDLAHVFERRRAILDSAIVRILKKEKQMSMDNIAHRIIKGCSVGRFDRGASFGRFDCDYRDVCSRVDRLIVNGYIKRDKTNRQMLIYVPDPSTADKDKEAVEDPTPESEDKQVKTKELSKEKSKSGSSSKASEEASPSIASGGAGVSSKLQLPRKRPGMGRQPQSKTKRKPTPFTRIYANEWYEQHEAPLLGMLPTSRSLCPDEVQFKIDSLMESVSLVLKVDRKNLELLLHHFQWNKDVLIQQYLDGSSKVLEEAGLSGKAVTSPPNRRRSVSCPVCLLSMPYKDLIWLWCNHACCKSCWQKHLLTQIDLDRSLQCSCPIFGCLARPSRAFFIKVFGLDTDPINKFSKAIVQSYVERSAWLTWCRNPQGCTQVLCRGDGMDTGTCRKCNWSSCFSCTFIESHQPATCEDIQKWAESGGFYVGMDEDAKSKQLANVIAKKCPGCGAQIEKNEGCLHMKCKCGHGFCWNCLKPWRPTHADYFNCSAKVSKAARDHKKFQDYTEQCASHHKSKGFAEKLCLMVKGISASVPIKTLSFLSDACQLLVQCHKMLLYTCVAEYFSKPDTSGYLGFLSENLEGDTNVLQAFLENTLLSTTDVARAISTLPEKRIQDGYCLVSKIENTRDKLLVGSQQQFKLGETSTLSSDIEEEDIGDMGEDECDYDNFDDDDDDEDDEDDDEVYIYSDYEDSFHDGFDDSWDEGYDYDDMYSFF